VPSGATTGNVVVFASGVNSNGVAFTVLLTPTINNPASPGAPVGGSVYVNGTGFGSSQGSGALQLNGASLSVGSWSDTSIKFTVPSGAASGPVTVATSRVTSNSSQFTLIEAASATGVSPSSGTVGSSTVITGAGFGATQSNSTVNFYGATATTITSWSDTSITLAVPSGAATGNVTVTVVGNTATGPVFTISTG
jgi:hypothetical protein